MKGLYGLLLAIALGVAGALLNWSYLARKSQDLERVAFLGIKHDVTVRFGDVFEEQHFEPVYIPKSREGNLRQFAVLYSDIDTAIGQPAVRDFEGGQLLLEKDLRALPPEPRALEPTEREIGIPVDTRTFIPSLYRAGDMVSFVVPIVSGAVQSAASDGDEEIGLAVSPTAPADTVATETIGPFEIRSIGNRVASSDLSRANRARTEQENVLNIIVKMNGDELEPRARKLTDLLLKSNFRQFVVLGHPRPKSN